MDIRINDVWKTHKGNRVCIVSSNAGKEYPFVCMDIYHNENVHCVNDQGWHIDNNSKFGLEKLVTRDGKPVPKTTLKRHVISRDLQFPCVFFDGVGGYGPGIDVKLLEAQGRVRGYVYKSPHGESISLTPSAYLKDGTFCTTASLEDIESGRAVFVLPTHILLSE